MADDRDDAQKTEDPTDKKRADAHKKGDSAKSQEVPTFFILLTATFVIWLVLGPMSANLANDMIPFLSRGHEISLEGSDITKVFMVVFWMLLGALIVPLSLFMLAGLAGNLVQNKPVFTFEKAKPSLQKISVIGGLKRMFGLQGLVNFLKGISKLSFVALVIFLIIFPKRDMLVGLIEVQPMTVLLILRDIALQVFIVVSMVVAVIAVFDFVYQKYENTKKLRMTKQEVKDEHKQSDGDPMVKARLRQVRMERAKTRMMASVPDATVIIANPTHFAVALKYESGTLGAPICVAKGVDHLAFAIREMAESNDVPVVENPPLARALYATVEINDEVPPEQYQAVAKVIGYVMQLKKRAF